MTSEMLDIYTEQGVGAIICTSHGDCNIEVYNKNLSLLKEKAWTKGIELYPGNEVLCFKNYMTEVVNDLKNGKLHTLNGTKYVLAEFYPYETVDNIFYCVEFLHKNGYQTVIAHIERCRNLFDNKKINILKDMGSLFQVNVYDISKVENKKCHNVKVGDKVWHEFYGDGTIEAISPSRFTVVFKSKRCDFINPGAIDTGKVILKK